MADNINGIPLIWDEEGDNELFKFLSTDNTGLKGFTAIKNTGDTSNFPEPAEYQSQFKDSLITYPDFFSRNVYFSACLIFLYTSHNIKSFSKGKWTLRALQIINLFT